ncbi:adenine deaminase [Friedmanniomyces endolithicus]|uniref:Adenine deaminase n=1 Tax=Friedmanniomyces endolithicus TaxID=329885 RepID=A0AAN6K6G5_9PEZI|nr:adenine deaminase [Friedmanniomyces endolithicus]KAK0835344.1 adenine deaminase [Friedmanniomyces endolithicus]KAK0872282.1 adenine deaminase [Friedmanniomyces endolithicus]KAK0879644.1 adenine deaminase [Friedmanniomyces endolithicus]KAK0893166.1 adenine deaminase [Friedmanniomyces endolithicus]
MCKSPLHPLLQRLPKCEHHLHLEGALTPQVLFSLAAKNHIELPEDDPAFASPESLVERYREFESLDDFLHYYYIGMSVLLDAGDFETLAWDYFTHAAADGVAHCEVFFDPQAHMERSVSYDIVLAGFQKARERAESELGITSELIACFLRHLPPAHATATLEHDAVQASFAAGHVIGIGLDSSEKPFPPELFQDVYRKAGALGLKMTAHAGEEGPAAYVKTALDTLRVQRIDHGVRVIEDEALLQRIAADKILLSICPISNVFLKGVASVADLPIRQFLDAGVRFSINSDDPAYFGNNYILANYCAVQEAFELSAAEWVAICEGSIDGSWCGQERKEELRARLGSVSEEWVGRCGT